MPASQPWRLVASAGPWGRQGSGSDSCLAQPLAYLNRNVSALPISAVSLGLLLQSKVGGRVKGILYEPQQLSLSTAQNFFPKYCLTVFVIQFVSCSCAQPIFVNKCLG